MTLQEIKSLAINLMTEHGLIQKGWSFKYNNHKNAAGVCHEHRYNTHLSSIQLSKYLMVHMTVDQIKDTILHEIAHALVGNTHGHDVVWRMKAMEIGCDGNRCYSDKAFKDGSKEILAKQAKYNLVCDNCGNVTRKHRRPKNSKACGKCCRKHNNGRYSDEYKMNVVQNY